MLSQPLADAAFLAVEQNDGVRLDALLKANPELLAARNEQRVDLLLWSIYLRRQQLIELLERHGAHLDLFGAAALGRCDLLREALRPPGTRETAKEQGARLSHTSPDGWTPLHLAAHFGQLPALDLLLDHGADLQAFSTNGSVNTPLHAAVGGRQPGAVEKLLVRGASPHITDAGGWTPLHLAAQNGCGECAELLLRYGADPNARNPNGTTPLALAQDRGQFALVTLLQSHGAGATLDLSSYPPEPEPAETGSIQ